MDFNPRMSMARGVVANTQSRNRQQEEDAFMTLPDREIASCINDIGPPGMTQFTVADLQKPNPQQIQAIFEKFSEVLLNLSREVVAPAMKAAAEELCGPDADRIFTADTRDLMGFFVMLRRLLVECGINDFSFQDLYRPTHQRLVKIFSYIINFIRFRESQTGVIDEHFNKSERTKLRIEQLYHENQAKEEQLHELNRTRQATERAMKDRERRNNELKQRLLELKKGQERVAEKLERVKEDQQRLKGILQEKTETTLQVKQEAHKLRPYTQQSRETLENALTDLSNNLTADKAQIETLDRRARALQTSADTFTVVTADVTSCTKLLTEVQGDLAKEEEEIVKASRYRDALSERSNNVRDVERQERLLQNQLSKINTRTDKLRSNAEEKAYNAKARMEELRAVHKQIADERSEKGREMERRRVRIEQTEKKMADLKENIENEVQSANEEYVKMESHIKLYITEMEQHLA
ncbi:kinetochore protein nuf2 [Pseudovirgaria hyperparasitica]|uniref:Probable kinetochore protein NUF2 n=1 Tax=Pseudovirgaria hyperparasitica TaxID=470096 RepID=A0A6A6VY15_9PEZI|nr:kinetochore protein nuf2 [Pseudovirgaria hyperparasitica]KAF2754540.1 kinetochore protein nuf2 [Pseudovirgaria hyperparasitica]